MATAVFTLYMSTSTRERTAEFNGLRIEIQIRSRLQHAWATAIETIDTFTNQAIKSGLGDPEWRNFFALCSSAIAAEEKSAAVPGMPALYGETIDQLRHLYWKLGVEAKFLGLSAGMMVTDRIDPAKEYLLILDSKERVTRVRSFNKPEDASRAYIDLERDTLGNPDIQAVLVSVGSISALKRAYPNYYLDNHELLSFLNSLAKNDELYDDEPLDEDEDRAFDGQSEA